MISTPPEKIRAFWVTRDDAGNVSRQVVHRPFDELPVGEVLIRVAYSSVNYKDALAATGHPAVAKKFPHVPGIDAAGTVVSDATSTFEPGDVVFVTGFDLGVGQWGGFCEYIRVPANWVLPVPNGLSPHEVMTYGTAGYTAALSVQALIEHGVAASSAPVVVTGATGGVGSLAVAILAKIGYHVAAVTGKPGAGELLKRLGAAELLTRQDVDQPASKPLLATRWSGEIDSVGGNTLGTILRSIKPGGCVAACGLVGGMELPITVYPFILRGITLCGIDSVWSPIERRRLLWPKLAAEWKPAMLRELTHEITLDELDGAIDRIFAGQMRGRTVVKIAE